jgi:hypothetical protein
MALWVFLSLLLIFERSARGDDAKAADPRCAALDISELENQVDEDMRTPPNGTTTFSSQAACVARMEQAIGNMIKGMTEALAEMKRQGLAHGDLGPPEPFCIIRETQQTYLGVFVATYHGKAIVDSIWQCKNGLSYIWH